MLPRASGVSGLVDAVADGQIGTDDGRPGADIDHVGVRWGHGDGANRAGGLVVEQRCPVRTVIGRAPDAAVVVARVERVGLAGDASQRPGPAGTRGTDIPPAHVAEREILGGSRRAGCGHDRECNGSECKKGAHTGVCHVIAPLANDPRDDDPAFRSEMAAGR
jgi:hypothetical protein